MEGAARQGAPQAGRLPYLDIAKGISILLVVLGHSRVFHGPTQANLVLGTIRMPLFFFVAGLFFKHRKTLFSLAREKGDSLLKPFFVTLGVLGIFRVLEGTITAGSYYGMLAYGNGRTIEWVPMWFLPHLWAVFVFSWILLRTTKLDQRSAAVRGIVLGGLLTIGFLTIQSFTQLQVEAFGKVHQLPGLPFTSDVLLLTSFFFLLGFLLRERVMAMAFRARWFWLALAVFVGLHLAFDDSIDFNTRRYDDLAVSTLAAFCGIYLVLSMSLLLARSPSIGRLVAYIGSMSLFVLIFHYTLQINVHRLLDAWVGDRAVPNAAIAFVVAVGASLLIGTLIKQNRLLSPFFLPFRPASPPAQRP
jgi:fucose 4-O-acetylase-like acetyltransferase